MDDLIKPESCHACVCGKSVILSLHRLPARARTRRFRGALTVGAWLPCGMGDGMMPVESSGGLLGVGQMTVDWAPDDVDVTKPSIARVYDYYLGGSHNFAVDREAANRVLGVDPNARQAAYENRGFLRRAVRFCIEDGVDQFLDIGSGIPTVGNVHEVAQAADPDARVVYVDIDPVAVTCSRRILAGSDTVRVLHADLKEPEQILNHPDLHEVLDLSRPVAVLMFAILWTVPEQDEAVGLIAHYRDRLVSGSYLAVSQQTADYQSAGYSAAVAEYARSVASVRMRSRGEVAEIFRGFELVDPGIVPVAEWRPNPEEEPRDLIYLYGAVGRKP